MSEDNTWSPKECSKIVRRDALLEEHIVEQYIDSINKKGATFSLYYFVKDLTFDNPKKPTVLFAAGGPGQMVLASSGDNFVDMRGYRVVYFHLRGTGFSQLPADMSFDKYLRTDYVVEDIEAIRRDFFRDSSDSKWLAIIGHSYGTIVAQCYAHEFPDSVEKVVLSAPIVPVSVLNSNASARDKSVEPKPLESLRRIYERDDFAFLDDIAVGDHIRPLREYIVNRGEDILKKMERLHWNVQFVADEYSRLNQQLRNDGLDLGAPFFSAVRKLRLCGWLPLDVPLARGGNLEVDTAQLESGLIIADALLKELKPPINLTEELEKQIVTANGQKKNDLEIALGVLKSSTVPIKTSQNTARAYYVISLHEGFNDKFQRELKRDSNPEKAVRAVGGEKGSNPSLERAAIGLTEAPKPWDPATKERKHGLPTLILKGGADPLNENGEAEYYFRHGLTGERALIEFPGVGHSMALPRLLNSATTIDEIISSLNTREALIDAFLSMTHPEFRKVRILTEIESAFEDALNGFKKSRPWRQKSWRSSKAQQDRLIKTFSP
jgi:pimeloyl-ACP methyl ester carboxylesterase